MTDSIENIQAAKTIDARGTACPGPLLEAKRGITSVGIGEVMELLSSDEETNEDVPLWSKKAGHDFLGAKEEAGFWRLYVKRSK